MKKSKTRWISALTALTLLLLPAFTACKGGVEWTDKIVWTDREQPPEPEVPESNSLSVVPPEKPAEKPEAQPGALPAVGEPIAAGQAYRIERAEGKIVVTYDAREAELEDWSYLYFPVSNFQPDYANLKFKLENDGAEFLSVQAVYYEMYDAKRPAVTVLSPRALRSGAEIVPARFGDVKVLDAGYNAVSGERLADQTILGFMVFVDSNPTAAMTDRAGKLTFSEISLVTDDDPDLKYEEAAPFISDWSTFGFTTHNLEKSQGEDGCLNAKVTYSSAGGYPFIQAGIQAYKADYASVKMTIKTENVTTLSVAAAHGGSTQYTFFTGAWGMNGANFSTAREVTFDFSVLTEEGKPDSFVKDLNPYELYFYVDSDVAKDSASIEITNIRFIRTSDSDAPEVSASWTSNGSFDISGVERGGAATVTYDRNNGWEPILVGVTAYNKAYTVLTVKLKAYGTENLGIAVNAATTVVKSNHDPIDNYATESSSGTDEGGAYREYTFVIDLTEKAEGLHVAQLLIYIDAAEDTRVTETRKVQFTSIVFSKPEA